MEQGEEGRAAQEGGGEQSGPGGLGNFAHSAPGWGWGVHSAGPDPEGPGAQARELGLYPGRLVQSRYLINTDRR